MQHEWRQGNYSKLEGLFAEALRPLGDLRMWRLYLNYVKTVSQRPRGEQEPPQQAKQQDDKQRQQTVQRAFDLALQHIGVDLGALSIYKDYIAFMLGQPTNSLYEQQQQMDAVRKIYTRALAMPLANIEGLWAEYDAWEGSLNRLTAKKMLADKSASYMNARALAKELSEEIVAGLNRDEYAFPPPHEPSKASRQMAKWLRWIRWEKGNPLGLPAHSPLLHQRIQYAYRSALGVLRLYGELWIDYAHWLNKEAGRREEAQAVLESAIKFLPRDRLLSFAYCDMLEETLQAGDQEEEQRATTRTKIKQSYEDLIKHVDPSSETGDRGEDDQQSSMTKTSPELARNVEQTEDPSPSAELTLCYINYMNYCRRTEGITAARAVFTRARKLACITFHIFVAAALMELRCKRDAVVAGRIFELGMARFAHNPLYIQAYLGHLLEQNDEQNAQALFERALLSLSLSDSFEIWRMYLNHLFRYGDDFAIRQLSKRFHETFPDYELGRMVHLLSQRYSWEDLQVAPERFWTQPTETTFNGPLLIVRPFFVSDAIEEMIGRLEGSSSASSDVRIVDIDMMLELLKRIRLPMDGFPFIPPMMPVPVGRKSSRISSSTTSRSTTGAKRRRGRGDRLDDGDSRPQPVNAPLRQDDIFAQRHRSRLE